MVDPINSGNISRLRPGDAPARNGQAFTPTPAAGKAAGANDAASLSDAATKAVSTLAAAPPPFDASHVARIKAAIESGDYPVNAERIADSFFRDFAALTE
ncbi:MAG: flagellar biosynthesis anti-sigma factor FlgM [Pseudomonadota bacterium]